MKIAKYDTAFETVVSINFIEIIRWFFFYFFLELILPLFFDPLGLYIEYFGYEIDDIIELCFFLLIPLMTMYFLDEVSGFGSLMGLLIYLFLTSFPFHFIYMMFFHDLYGTLLVVAFIADTLTASESETSHELDLY